MFVHDGRLANLPPKEGVEAMVIRNDTDDVGSVQRLFLFFCFFGVWVFEFFVFWNRCFILHGNFSLHGNSKTLELALCE